MYHLYIRYHAAVLCLYIAILAQISMVVESGHGEHKGRTKTITFRPRYLVANFTPLPLCLRQTDPLEGPATTLRPLQLGAFEAASL